ncbi:MBL fold metallo-hydrolase [Salinisphaera sp. S4-8]|uniref:MBL fold metallo-hydrolase n=1 Tax=Salinisphaera sp. S4-8 TaxID=633357 RepID=UPI00334025B4
MPATRIHHLNCASMHPLGRPLLEHPGQLQDFHGLVCHCLLIETEAGLILVDTGLGVADVTQGRSRLGGMFSHVVRPALRHEETARHQIEALGFSADDVRHIVLTHLDVDHAGGIGDFPQARVHVLASEYAAAQPRRHIKERDRYRPAQWAATDDWKRYEVDGERWQGFDAVRAIVDSEPDILLVPLTGHTRGHAAIAVRAETGWLLHAGDAYFHRDEIGQRPCCPFGLKVFERLMAVDNRDRARNQARLRELALSASDIDIFCSHDPVEFARASGSR